MKRDPRMKKKGRVWVCAVCDEPLNELTIAHGDPFCKAKCAHAWYELDFSHTPTQKGILVNGK